MKRYVTIPVVTSLQCCAFFIFVYILETQKERTTFKINFNNNNFNILQGDTETVGQSYAGKIGKKNVKRKEVQSLQSSNFTKRKRLRNNMDLNELIKIHRIKHMKPVVELHNVCFKEINTKRQKDVLITVHGPNKLYLGPLLVDGYRVQYKQQGVSSNVSLIHGFRVQHLPDDIPDYKYQKNHVAFFIDTLIWPFTNLCHFFKDFMIDFHLMMQNLGIPISERKSLYFDKSVQKPTWIKPLLDAVNISDMFFNMDYAPNDVCFKKAIFANTKHCEHCKLPQHDDVTHLIGHYKNYFQITDEKCVDNGNNILIIDRKTNRKILNIDQLEHELQISTFVSVEKVVMETLSLRQQMQKVYCSDVLIGVHGAGLTWALFMKPGSHLIEISWPTAGGLDFFYTIPELAASLYPDISLHRVEAFNITDSFTQRKQEFLTRVSAQVGLHSAEALRHTEQFIQKLKEEILNTPPARYADVNVDVRTLMDLVSTILDI